MQRRRWQLMRARDPETIGADLSVVLKELRHFIVGVEAISHLCEKLGHYPRPMSDEALDTPEVDRSIHQPPAPTAGIGGAGHAALPRPQSSATSWARCGVSR